MDNATGQLFIWPPLFKRWTALSETHGVIHWMIALSTFELLGPGVKRYQALKQLKPDTETETVPLIIAIVVIYCVF